MSTKNKRIGVYLYIIGLIVGFLFVQNTLNLKSVDVVTKEVDKTEPKIKKVRVNLKVETDAVSKSYTYELTDSESVFDLLQLAREDDVIYFETTEYSSRTDLDFINYNFNIFLDGNDITDIIGETNLVDENTYSLVLTPTRTEGPR